MGKIIQSGAQFLSYANARLIRKIDDDLSLRSQLIQLAETKSHQALCDYGLALATHLIDLSQLQSSALTEACFTILHRWKNHEVPFQEALEIAGQFNDLARNEPDPIKVKAYRALGQIAAIPHVRWHALVASEYAIVMINLMYPGDKDRVTSKRQFQIDLLTSIH